SRETLADSIRSALPAALKQLLTGEYNYARGKAPTVILADNENHLARLGSNAMKFALRREGRSSLLVGAGRTLTHVYDRFVADYEPGLAEGASFFTTFEYLGVPPASSLSRRRYLDRILFGPLEQREDAAFHVNYVPGVVVGDENLPSLCQSFDRELVVEEPFLGLLSASSAGESAGICPDESRGVELRSQRCGPAQISFATA
ncbi:MAG: hypothetical protein GY953_42035, partial [bacterium]|nr:hypothetical protein [bacterium]